MVDADRLRVEEYGVSPGPGDPARLARALLDSVVAITSNLDVHVVLSRLLAAACEVTGADDAALAVFGRDGAVVETVRIMDGHDDPRGEDAGPCAAVDWSSRTRSPDAAANSVLVPVLARGVMVGSIHVSRQPGRRAFAANDLDSVDPLANAFGFVIDGARSQDCEELRRRWLESSAWLSEALRPPIDGQLALKRITAVARSISGAAATAFIQWPADGRPSITMVDDTTREDVESLVEKLLSGQTLSSAPEEVLHVLVDGRRAIVLPLRSQIAVPAALVAFFDERGHLPAADESGLLESLAGHASLALDRVQAAADRADLEDVSRRDRVARDLHDVVIQRLFATGLLLEGMRRGLNDPETLERLDLAVEEIDVTIRHIREAILAADRAHAVRS
jgi:hypothetical protein